MYKRYKKIGKMFYHVMCFFVVGSLAVAYADTPPSAGNVEDVIKVETVGNEIIGSNTRHTDGRVKAVENLKEGESVTSALSKGKVGAVLTNRRLLGVNANNNTWTSFETFINKEVFPNEIKVSSNIAVAIAKRRIYAYTSTSNEWRFELLFFSEQILSCDINDNLIFVRTNTRLLAFNKDRWFAQNLLIGETINDVAIGENFVTVTTDNNMFTDKRILTFNAKSGAWTEDRLKPGASPSKEQADVESGDKSKAAKAPDSNQN